MVLRKILRGHHIQPGLLMFLALVMMVSQMAMYCVREMQVVNPVVYKTGHAQREQLPLNVKRAPQWKKQKAVISTLDKDEDEELQSELEEEGVVPEQQVIPDDTFEKDADFVSKVQYKLVLFTSFSDVPKMDPVHRAILENWSELSPGAIKPVLYVNNDSASGIFSEGGVYEGWDVRALPKMNSYGTPFINHMFQDVYSNYSSWFYAYAKEDILFSGSITEHLTVIRTYFNRVRRKAAVVVVGRSKEYMFTESTPEWISEPSEIDRVAYGLPMNSTEMKFFMTEKNTFPWYETPDLVIGRPGMDSVLMHKSNVDGIHTVDVTHTLNVLHLQGEDAKPLDFKLKHMDSDFNHKYMGVDFDITLAQAANCRYETYQSQKRHQLWVRYRHMKKQAWEMPTVELRQAFKKLHYLPMLERKKLMEQKLNNTN